MNDYESDKDAWKSEVGRAAARFIINVTTMVPLIGAALGAGLFIHSLFSEPFGFSCKSLPPENSVTVKPRVHRVRVIPIAPTQESERLLPKPAETVPDSE